MRHGMGAGFAFRGRGTLCAVLPVALVGIGCALFMSPRGVGQTAGVNQGGPGYVHQQVGGETNPQNSESASKVDQMRQAEQRRRVLADTAKLVELSNELKAAVDASSKDQLSLEVLRKAAEIEKTAHDLKGWVKY